MTSQKSSKKSALLTIMTEAAEMAGRVLTKDYFEIEHLQSTVRPHTRFAQNSINFSERAIRQYLERTRPQDEIIFTSWENSMPTPQDGFYIEAINGFENFQSALPFFSTTISYFKSGKCIACLIFNPISAELFWAEIGQGAYLNQQRLRASFRKEGMPLLAGTSLELAPEFKETFSVRVLESPALNAAFVAAGRFDVGVLRFPETSILPFEPLIEEAGGITKKLTGENLALFFGESFEPILEKIFPQLRKFHN